LRPVRSKRHFITSTLDASTSVIALSAAIGQARIAMP
jgi:hypothetical protein